MLVKGSKMNESFESKKDDEVIFASGYHSIDFYCQENCDTMANVVFNHPEVEAIAYIYEDTLTE